jgi:phosphotransferase system, enzyme I, PtsP
MLAPLRRILEAVDRAPSLDAALAVLVHEVKDAIGADVCSVYLTDPDRREHVLLATDGLPPDAVGRVRVPLNRGLIGRAAERADIVNLDDAHTHPSYLKLNETGDDQYHGFWACPSSSTARCSACWCCASARRGGLPTTR